MKLIIDKKLMIMKLIKCNKKNSMVVLLIHIIRIIFIMKIISIQIYQKTILM